jgi:hypothetical protein
VHSHTEKDNAMSIDPSRRAILAGAASAPVLALPAAAPLAQPTATVSIAADEANVDY